MWLMLKLLLVPLWLCHGLVLEASAADERPDAVLCPLSEYIDDNEQVVKEYFECPGHGDPSNHRNCCEDKCCPMVDSVLQLDIQVAMTISITVICICVISAITIIVCCFVPSCPMYDTCSGSWSSKEKAHANPFVGGYIPSDMHPLTLNGSKESDLNQLKQPNGRQYHKLAPGLSPVKVAEEADCV